MLNWTKNKVVQLPTSTKSKLNTSTPTSPVYHVFGVIAIGDVTESTFLLCISVTKSTLYPLQFRHSFNIFKPYLVRFLLCGACFSLPRTVRRGKKRQSASYSVRTVSHWFVTIPFSSKLTAFIIFFIAVSLSLQFGWHYLSETHHQQPPPTIKAIDIDSNSTLPQ